MIDFEHVSKEYKKGGKLALEDVNFHVDDGEFVFLLGHSGAGKSTLLKLILREEVPSEGKVLVDGRDVARMRRRQIPYLRRQMGIIFQDFRLIPSMTVYENIAFAMHVTNIGRKQIKERVGYMLELVHLEDKADVYPEFLSGGEQQRVAVARALALRPQAGHCRRAHWQHRPQLSLEMMELLERVGEMGITVLVVTHEHELVHRFHQRVVTLKRGRIISDVPRRRCWDPSPRLSRSLPSAACATWASTGHDHCLHRLPQRLHDVRHLLPPWSKSTWTAWSITWASRTRWWSMWTPMRNDATIQSVGEQVSPPPRV